MFWCGCKNKLEYVKQLVERNDQRWSMFQSWRSAEFEKRLERNNNRITVLMQQVQKLRQELRNAKRK